MLLRLLNFFRGNVRIEMRGACIERMLNVCAFHGIAFWDLEWEDSDLVYATVYVSGFRKMRKFARRTMTKVRIKKRTGVPFLVFRYRGRQGLWGGALFLAGLLFFLTSFVWTIEVQGTSHVTPLEIIEALGELGLKTGVRKRTIDPTDLKNRMLLKVEGISWITINLKGTHAEVIVREREETPYMIPRSLPCDIVAGKTGVIQKMNVKEGKALFSPGQTVLKGEILVTGFLVSEKSGDVRTVHSLAEVQARTWYSLSGKASVNYFGKSYTGRKKVRKALVFGNRRVNLYFYSSIPFDFCDKIMEKEKVVIGKNMYLPVAVVTETFFEYEPEKTSSASGEISTGIKRSLEKRLRDLIQGGIVQSASYTVTQDGNAVTVVLDAECMEEIALEKELSDAEIRTREQQETEIKE